MIASIDDSAVIERILEHLGRDAAPVEIFEHESGRADSIGNDATSIETWLDSKAGRLQLAIESTNRYHEAVAEAAYARGHEVY